MSSWGRLTDAAMDAAVARSIAIKVLKNMIRMRTIEDNGMQRLQSSESGGFFC